VRRANQLHFAGLLLPPRLSAQPSLQWFHLRRLSTCDNDFRRRTHRPPSGGYRRKGVSSYPKYPRSHGIPRHTSDAGAYPSSARRSTRCARQNTPACAARTGDSIKGRFIKGQIDTLLSHRDNLRWRDGKRSLALLLAANKHLNTAYSPERGVRQLWDYRREGWARPLLRQLARPASSGSGSSHTNGLPT